MGRKRILVLPNRRAAERLRRSVREEACWIAVTRGGAPPGGEEVRPRFFAFLEFDDVRHEREAAAFGLAPLDEAQALYAAETLLEALAAGVEEFVFSCEAGVSRSAGLARAFARFLAEEGVPCEQEHLRPPAPNPLAEERLLEALRRARG